MHNKLTNLAGKTVVITAGNRGGGLALSKKFADNGAHVVMIADVSDLNINPSEPLLNSKIIAVDFDNETGQYWFCSINF